MTLTWNDLDIPLRLSAAVALGGIIGLERSYRGRAAGFRTYALVCLGAAIVMVASTQPAQWIYASIGELAPIDPTRSIQGLVTGVGFLGAGVIFRDGFSVRGLTTAASIWVTAAVGVMVGMGMMATAAVSVLLTLAALSLFRAIENRLPQQYYSIATILYGGNAPDEATVVRLLADHGFHVAQASYRMLSEGRAIEFTLRVWSSGSSRMSALSRTLAQDRSILQFSLSPMQE